jgi:hypothetical protein
MLGGESEENFYVILPHISPFKILLTLQNAFYGGRNMVTLTGSQL